MKKKIEKRPKTPSVKKKSKGPAVEKKPPRPRRLEKPSPPPITAIRAAAAAVTSPSHPSQTAWSSQRDVLLQWTFPVADKKVQGIYCVVDHFGDTEPAASASFVPASQKQFVKTGCSPGIWVFHVAWSDQQGRLASVAHYQVRIGVDPGVGTLVGTVRDPANAPVSGATVSINRGLFPAGTTESDGTFSLTNVPAGQWALSARGAGFQPLKRNVAVTVSTPTVLTLTLTR